MEQIAAPIILKYFQVVRDVYSNSGFKSSEFELGWQRENSFDNTVPRISIYPKPPQIYLIDIYGANRGTKPF